MDRNLASMPKVNKTRKKKAAKEAKAQGINGHGLGGGRRSLKLKKDPNRPTGPCPAFMYFGKEARVQVKEASPEMSFGEIAKKVAEKWRGLTDEEKSPFEALATKDKERYKAAMADYVPPPAEYSGGSTKKNKKKKNKKADVDAMVE